MLVANWLESLRARLGWSLLMAQSVVPARVWRLGEFCIWQRRRRPAPRLTSMHCLRKCCRGAKRCAGRRRWRSLTGRCQTVVLHAPGTCIVRGEGWTASCWPNPWVQRVWVCGGLAESLVCEVPTCACQQGCRWWTPRVFFVQVLVASGGGVIWLPKVVSP